MADLTNATWLGLDPEELTPEQLQEMQMAQQEPLPPEALAAMSPQMAPAAPQASGPNEIRDALIKATNEDLQNQRKGVDTMSKSITDLLSKGSGGIDFTPLAALADSWSGKGGNAFTQAAQASKPMSEEQRMSFASKLQDELQRRRGDLSKAQMEALKSQLQYGAKQNAADEKKMALTEKKQEKDAMLNIPGFERDPNVIPSLHDVSVAREATATQKTFDTNIKKLGDLILKNGGYQVTGPDSEVMKTLTSNLYINLKVMEKLGVLSASDMELLKAQIPSTNSFMDAASRAVRGITPESIVEGMNALSTSMKTSVADSLASKGYKAKLQKQSTSPKNIKPPGSDDPAMARLQELRKKFGK